MALLALYSTGHARGNTSIRLKFQFRGVECRETLKLPATPANLKYAHFLPTLLLML